MVSILLGSSVTFSAQCTRGVTFGAGGGQKIAILIDSSTSNMYTDSKDLRIAAAKDFNSRLTSKDEAGTNCQPDLVTVIDFDRNATVRYSLGDPSNATFDGIDAAGGTFIAGGIDTAINELTRNEKSQRSTLWGGPGSDKTTVTDSSGNSSIALSLAKDANLELAIKIAEGTDEGLFVVTLESSDTTIRTECSGIRPGSSSSSAAATPSSPSRSEVSPASSFSLPKIIGSVVAGVLVVTLLIAFQWWRRRRRHRQQQPSRPELHGDSRIPPAELSGFGVESSIQQQNLR
ncbi:hypothetical protein K440DRAFT_667033 [Wilcoxina mikolae CBS 423.85]|nr:hypothetical protein K440DRAFT_667033 [Wilcoxina mikolae CBS 423.85]